MEHQKTSYDTLLERIDYLIQEISEIKNILTNRIEKKEEIPKYLSTENALAYLKKTGFPMSKSQLYKLTSCGRMPFHKSGNTLLFIPEELDKWCEDKIQTVSHEENELQLLIKSPLNKWKKKSMMKKLLTQRIKKTEEIPKYLFIKQAKLYLEKKDFW